jgi:hypothetical protein
VLLKEYSPTRPVTHRLRSCLKGMRTQPCIHCGASVRPGYLHSEPLIAFGITLGPTCDDCFGDITEPSAENILSVIGRDGEAGERVARS